MLQCVAVCVAVRCSVLLCVCDKRLSLESARRCNTVYTATHCNTVETATHCNTVETATHCNTVEKATHRNTKLDLDCNTTHCNTQKPRLQRPLSILCVAVLCGRWRVVSCLHLLTVETATHCIAENIRTVTHCTTLECNALQPSRDCNTANL